MLSCALAALLLSVGLVRGERLAFSLFPSPETAIVNAEAKFISGTPPAQVERFATHLADALRETEAHFGEPLVKVTVARIGDQSADLIVELVEPDQRETRNPALIAAWRERIEPPPGMESLSLVEQRDGPSGRDIVVNLTGDDAGALKAAALDLAAVLAAAPGVSGVEDDLPFGQEQLVYRLTPQASAPRADRGRRGRAVARRLRRAPRADLPARGRGAGGPRGPARRRAPRPGEPRQPLRLTARRGQPAAALRGRDRARTGLRRPAPFQRAAGGRGVRGRGLARQQQQRGDGGSRGGAAARNH